MCDSRQPANGADSSSSPTTEAAATDGIDWPKSWTADDIAWVKRQVVAAARDEGRREAVRSAVRYASHGRSPLQNDPCGSCALAVEEVLEMMGAAGLGDAEPPPTHMRQSGNGCVTCPRRWSDHTAAERGDASESPPTHVHERDDYPGGYCLLGDASESGQPPEAER